MEFSFITIFGVSIAFMILVFTIYFAVKSHFVYSNLTEKKGQIFFGSCIAGGASGIVVGFAICLILPTYYYVTEPHPDGHSKRYVLDSNFSNTYGRRYIVNNMDEPCYLMGMTYGDREFNEDEEYLIEIMPGCTEETKHDVDEWFKPFPNQIRIKNDGAIKWHVLTERMIIDNLRLMDIDLNE